MFLAETVGLGGAERVVLHWAKEAEEAGSTVSIFHSQPGGLHRRELLQYGDVTQRTPKEAVAAIKALRPTTVVLNISETFAPILQQIRPFVGRVVCLIHSMAAWSHRFLTSELLGLYDHVVVIADYQVAQAIRFGAPAEKVVCIENVVDTENFLPIAVRGHTGFKFGYAGRACSGKRFGQMPDVLAELRSVGVDASFYLIGLSEEGMGASTKYWEANKALFVERAQQLGVLRYVKFLPARSNLSGFYSGLDASLLISRAEGSPCMVWESLACGTSVVVTDVGDVRGVCVRETGSIVIPNIEGCTSLASRALLSVAARSAEESEDMRSAARTLVESLRGPSAWRAAHRPTLLRVLGIH